MPEISLLFVTIGASDADEFVQTLCSERLIACGNIVPDVRSHYRWQGELCCESEVAVWMETSADRLEAAMTRAEALHPYECPKIVALTPQRVNEGYARWVVHETTPQP
jgi:periplasmic divalent cation tolerance protein